MIRIPVDDMDKEIRWLASYDKDNIARYDFSTNCWVAISKEGHELMHYNVLEEWHKYLLPHHNFAMKCEWGLGYFELVEGEPNQVEQMDDPLLQTYEIFDKSSLALLRRDIKETFKGEVTVKALTPMKYIDFDYINVYAKGIELKSYSTQDRLFVRFRRIFYNRPTKRFRKQCIKLLKLSV